MQVACDIHNVMVKRQTFTYISLRFSFWYICQTLVLSENLTLSLIKMAFCNASADIFENNVSKREIGQ